MVGDYHVSGKLRMNVKCVRSLYKVNSKLLLIIRYDLDVFRHQSGISHLVSQIKNVYKVIMSKSLLGIPQPSFLDKMYMALIAVFFIDKYGQAFEC